MGCVQKDTIQIDSVPIGNYTLIFHVDEIVGFPNNQDTLYNQALDTAQIIITNTLNLNTNLFVQLYPNPTKEYINIETKNIQIYNIQLFDIQGRLIQDIHQNKRKIDVKTLPNGCYMLRIKTDRGWINKKIIKY